MATGGKDDLVEVAPDEVYDATKSSKAGLSVGVEGTQDAKPGDDAPTDQVEKERNPPTEEKSTVAEGGTKPTMKEKIKGKIDQVADKLRPKGALESRSADPHPELNE